MSNKFEIPETLKQMARWVGVKLVPDENGKLKKIPVDPTTDKPLTGQWHTKFGWKFEDVKTELKGFALRKADNISIIDLDSGNDPTSISYKFAQDLVHQAGSFAEVSQSGKGLHVIVSGKVDNRIYAKDDIGLEVYSESRFFALTGKKYNGSKLEVADNQPLLDNLFKVYGKPVQVNDNLEFNGSRITITSHPEYAQVQEALGNKSIIQVYLDKLSPERTVDRETWLEVGMCLNGFYEGKKEGRELWDEWSKQCAEKYSHKEILRRWSTFEYDPSRPMLGMSRLEALVETDTQPVLTIEQPQTKAETILQRLAEGTLSKEPEPIFGPKNFHGAFWASDSWTDHEAPIYWIDNILPEDSLTMIYGGSGEKKSLLMAHMIVALATGQSHWLNNKVHKQMNILLLDEENGPKRSRERFYSLFNGFKLAPGTVVPIKISSVVGVNLTDPSWLLALDAELATGQFGCVVLDALVDVAAGADENSVRDIQPVFSALKVFTTKYHVSFLILHHTNKGSGDYRGSTAIKAAVDVAIKVESPHGSDKIKVTYAKGRDSNSKGFMATFYKDPDAHVSTITYDGMSEDHAEPVSRSEQDILDVLNIDPEKSWSSDELFGPTGLNLRSYQRSLRLLEEKSKIVWKKSQGRKGGGEIKLAMEMSKVSIDNNGEINLQPKKATKIRRTG